MILKFGHLFPRHLIYIYIYTNIHVDHKRAYTYSVLKLIHNFSNFHSPSSTPVTIPRQSFVFLFPPPSLLANQRLHYFSSPLNDFTFATTSTSNAPCPLIIVCAARIGGNINGRSWWTTFRETLIAMFFITCIQWCQFNGISVRIASRLS